MRGIGALALGAAALFGSAAAKNDYQPGDKVPVFVNTVRSRDSTVP